jgi:UDP-N-acetylmuramoyl-tripeptide--D-alanyl-D-alanine ligase
MFNVYNALAAVSVGKAFGVAASEASRALSKFVPEKQRLNRVVVAGVTIIDDSYNANPASVLCALEVLMSQAAARRIVVLGDMLELGEDSEAMHEKMGRTMKDMGVDILLTYGRFAAHVLNSARKAGLETAMGFERKSDLVAALKDTLKEGDVVLVKGSRGMGMEDVVKELTDGVRHG